MCGSPPCSVIQHARMCGSPPCSVIQHACMCGSPPCSVIQHACMCGSPPCSVIQHACMCGSPPCSVIQCLFVVRKYINVTRLCSCQFQFQAIVQKERCVLMVSTVYHAVVYNLYTFTV